MRVHRFGASASFAREHSEQFAHCEKGLNFRHFFAGIQFNGIFRTLLLRIVREEALVNAR